MIKRIVKIFFIHLTNIWNLQGIQIHHDVKQVMQYPWLEKSLLRRTITPMKTSFLLSDLYGDQRQQRRRCHAEGKESASGENSILLVILRPAQGIQTLSDELKKLRKAR